MNISASNKVNITSGSAIRKRFFPNSGLGDNENLLKKFGYSAAFTFSDFFLSGFDTYVQKLANKFIDLTFIRTIIEVFTRPIEGTTKIKSFSFVQIEAGKGSTDFPAGTLKSEDEPFFPKLNRSIDAISSAIDSRIDAINAKYQALFAALADFRAISGEADYAANQNYDAISFNKIIIDGTSGTKSYKESDIVWPDRLQDVDFDADAAENDVKEEMKRQTGDNSCDHKPDKKDERYNENDRFDRGIFNMDNIIWDYCWDKYYKGAKDQNKLDNQDKARKRKVVVKKASALVAAFANLKSAIDSGKADVKTMRTFKTEETTAVKDAFDELDLPLDTITKDDEINEIIHTPYGYNMAVAKKKWKRKAVWKLLVAIKNDSSMKVKGYTFHMDTYNQGTDVTNADKWSDTVEAFATEGNNGNDNNQDKKGFGSSWGSHFVNTGKNEWKTWANNSVVDPWRSTFSNLTRWKTGAEGKILLSDQPSITSNLNAQGALEKLNNATASDKYIAQFKNKLKNIE